MSFSVNAQPPCSRHAFRLRNRIAILRSDSMRNMRKESGLVLPGLVADGCDGRRVEQHEREEDPREVQAEREAEEAEEQRPAGDERLAALPLLLYRSFHLTPTGANLERKSAEARVQRSIRGPRTIRQWAGTTLWFMAARAASSMPV